MVQMKIKNLFSSSGMNHDMTERTSIAKRISVKKLSTRFMTRYKNSSKSNSVPQVAGHLDSFHVGIGKTCRAGKNFRGAAFRSLKTENTVREISRGSCHRRRLNQCQRDDPLRKFPYSPEQAYRCWQLLS